MATTTNYSWTTPDDTALVKDGAAAIRSLGTAIDTTVFNNAGAAIAKTIVDAKGDIIAATAADTVARLAVGANDTVLTADSSTATGLKWAAPAGGGKVLQVVSAVYSTSKTIASTSFTDTDLSLSITPTSATSKVLVMINLHSRSNRNNIVNAGTIKLVRASTDVWNASVGSRSFGSAGTNGAAELDTVLFMPIIYLDSPATTSATTYKVQAKCDDTNQNGFVLFHGNTNESTITLMEIGA